VHRGLLAKSVAPSDAALAFVLGHEISHTLLKHGEDKLWLDVGLLMGTMAIVGSLDPTGMLSLGAEMMIAPFLKYTMSLPFGRSHESEADALGLQICAKACYNPDGAQVMYYLLLTTRCLLRRAGLLQHAIGARRANASNNSRMMPSLHHRNSSANSP
jgi:Zn-dependent protease with chaperone function